MAQVLTLAARSADAIAAARDSLAAAGLQPAATDWLEPERALDLLFEAAEDLLPRVRPALADAAVDYAVQPAGFSRKRLLVADMDSTIISCEGVDELADFAGVKPEVAAITERAMRGELPFEAALQERVRLLKGLPHALVERCYAERVRLNPGAATLVATMRAHGARTVLVSGGFDVFAERVAAAAGFNAWAANRLLSTGEALSGEVALPILGREAKLERLRAECADLGLAERDALAIGDGANDIAMIERAGLGVGYHAKPALQAAARGRIACTDLTAALYFQGYRRDSWVEQP